MNDGQCSGPDVLSENRGIKNLDMVCVSKQIWELPLRKKVTVTAEYLPCALNKHADIESRRKKTLLNGSKTPQCSKDCVKKRKPLIDLFASRVFHQLPTYVAWRRDPYIVATFAFSITLNKEFYYAFPPF